MILSDNKKGILKVFRSKLSNYRKKVEERKIAIIKVKSIISKKLDSDLELNILEKELNFLIKRLNNKVKSYEDNYFKFDDKGKNIF